MNDPGLETSTLTVRLGAIADNYRICARLSGTRIAGVVKANAYGLGMKPVARALGEAGCDTFFVARVDEGVALRPIVPNARIFVLDGASPTNVEALLAHRLTPTLNSLEEISVWSAAAQKQGGVLDAAIHIDTGMSRLGIPAHELTTLASEVRERLRALNLALIMSHLACSDDPSAQMNSEQLGRFRAALALLPPAPASLAASGGIMLGRDYAFDLARPGIALYGGNPQPVAPNPFKTVARLTGRVLQLLRVDKGGTVGYGASFHAERPTTLATVALGYADGLMRSIGNRGRGAIDGRTAPVAGRVSMDLVTLDVTEIPTVAVGMDVEFFGDTISLEVAAASARTANYETLTAVGARVPRVYVSAS
ncbi:MAG TPA: alanine racemase [Rhizomicrobium sp.]|jgi:alanine racemase